MKRERIECLEFLQMGFGYNAHEKVFADLSFKFNAGEVLYLQGPRGSGKNTFIKLLLGLVSPTQGHYLINGTSVNDFSYSEFDSFRLNMGHSFDVGGLINNLTLYENFRLPLDYHDFLGVHERFDFIVAMLERFHLNEQKHLRPAFVSASARKAASVLRAFALLPEMIILNDPTQGMSMEHVPVLVELIKHHQRRHGLKHVIIATDDVGLLRQLEGRIMSVTTNGLQEVTATRRAG